MYAIPAARLIDWSYCGIPGGIPNRTTIYASLLAGATPTEINNAIAACPSGQVVYLTAGTHALSASQLTLAAKNGVTLRGAGPGSTIVTGSAAALLTCNTVSFNTAYHYLSSGYTKGSMAITLATAPSAYFQVGRLIQIDQNDDSLFYPAQIAEPLVWCRTGNWMGTRNQRFTARITGIVGNVVSFTPPLPFTLNSICSPGVRAAQGQGPALCGIEQMTLRNTGQSAEVELYGADRCWLYKVELSGGGENSMHSGLIRFIDSAQCEIRRSYWHDCYNWPGQAEGYGVCLHYGCSSFLIEDNIGYRTAMGILYLSASGCAATYNFMWNMGRDGVVHPWTVAGLHCNHGPHSIMNLWEGNSAERFQNDGYHGNASHQTLFRNRIHGVNPSFTMERQLIDLARGSYYHNLVGNVIGDPTWNPAQYDGVIGTVGHSGSCVYTLGWPNSDSEGLIPDGPFTNYDAAYPDVRVASTLLRHANYDYFNDATQWSDADHVLPNSLLYASKPAWFGTLPWPPIGPDLAAPYYGQTPAAWRWAQYLSTGLLSALFADSPGGVVENPTTVMFAKGRKALLDGSIHWLTDDIKAVAVDHAVHDPDPAVDEWLADIDAGARLFTSGNLGGKTSTGGVADATDTTIAGVSAGLEVDSVVLYKDTGDPATSPLICKIDSSTGLAFITNGAGFNLVWPSAGIFRT